MAADILGARITTAAYAQAFAVPVADTLVPLAVQRAGSAVVAASTTAFVVPTGKVFRLSALTGSLVAVGATVTTTRMFLRYNTAGNVTVTSPIAATFRLGFAGTPAANWVSPFDQDFTEGLEFAAGTGIGISALATTVSMHTLDINLIGFDFNA